MKPDTRAKYLNGPETEVFDKGRLLYGLFEARKILHAAGEGAPLAVVEGYMDVIACQRAGIAGVAPMGTALTEEQMALLWRLHPEPTLCFDGDGAGQRAASRAIDRALPLLEPRRTFRFSLPVGGKDPDDVLREQGAEALRAQLGKTRPLVEVLFEREKGADALATPEQRAGLRQRLRTAARAIQHGDLSRDYQAEFQRRCDALFAPMKAQGRQWLSGAIDRRAIAVPPATDALKNAAAELKSFSGPTIEGLLAKPDVTPEEAALFDLLTAREDVERQIAAVKEDFAAEGASALLADLVRQRQALTDQIKIAQFGQGEAA